MSRQTAQVRVRMEPPQVSLRTLREAYGLNIPGLVERIEQQGVVVTADHISNCELGWKSPSNALLHAWARALGITRLDVTTPADRETNAPHSAGTSTRERVSA